MRMVNVQKLMHFIVEIAIDLRFLDSVTSGTARIQFFKNFVSSTSFNYSGISE